jgi:hypothetical protein
MLDEWDNADLAEVRRVQNFMVDFMLTDNGELELQAFGERSLDDIWGRAYPILAKARRKALATSDGEPTEAGKEVIRKAVQNERERLADKKERKLADTEIGRSLQRQMGIPTALANRYVKRVAAEVLKKSPTSGRKQ